MILNLLIFSSWVSLQNGNTKDIQLNVSGNSYEKTRLEFTVSGLFLDTVVINGKSYSKINIPGTVTYLKRGYPALPKISKSVIVPDDKEMKFRIVREETERLKVLPVMPSKGNILRNISPSSVPYAFSDFYSSSRIFPAETITVSKPFIIRDFRGVTVCVNPVRYDAENKELIIVKKLVVEIYSEGFSLSNVKKREEKRNISQSIKNIYKDFFINYSESNLRYDMVEENEGRMIVICADEYASEMDSFLFWKRKRGIFTDLYSLSEIGSDTASIRSFIQNQYDSLGIAFCLLVGDADELPPYKGTVGLAEGKDSDPVYAYTDGNDKYPDLFIGRFSSNGGEVENIRNQVMRSIRYERNPGEGVNWYNRGLMIASNLTDDFDSIMDKQRCEWLKDTLLYNISPYFTYTAIDSSYNPWGTSDHIFNVINAGVSNINYIGHGSINGWQNGGGFNRNHLAALINYEMLPHVITVGCQVGNFNGINCFSEEALTAGTPEAPTGFIVTLAPTIDQTWVPPCIGQEGAINLLAHYDANTAGGVYFNGLNYMIEQYGGDTSDIGVEMAQTWHIFGDPSIQLRTDIPRHFKVNKLVSNLHDSLVCDINVFEEDSLTPIENAFVSFFSKQNILLASGYTNSAGNYEGILDSINYLQNEYVYITVTDFNYKPHMDSTILMNMTFFPESLEVNTPTEVEILASSGSEVIIDGYGFWACDTTDTTGRIILNVNALYGEDLRVSFSDTSEGRLSYMKTLPVFGAVDLPNPFILGSCDTIGVYGGFMPGFPGRIIGSTDSLSFSIFLRGAGIDTSIFVPNNFFESDLVFEEMGEVEVTLGKVGYNVYQEVFPVTNHRGWLSGYAISGDDSVGGIVLGVYNSGVDTSNSTLVATITTDENGSYELRDSLLCGYYDIYAKGVEYQDTSYTITVKNSSNDIDFNISPEALTFDIYKIINEDFLEVKYSIPQQMNIEFSVYDALGRKVTSMAETKNPGNFTQIFDIQDFSSGVYFFVMQAGNRAFAPEKFVLIR